MEVLIFLVALVIVGGVLSAQHAVIKPVVDWMYPPEPINDLEIADLLKEVEELQQEIRERENARKPLPLPPDRTDPNGSRAVLRLLEKQKAEDARKRHLRAAIAEHERRPKPPRHLP